MMKRLLISCPLVLLLASCYQPQRDCKSFKNGRYTFTTTIDGEEKTTLFVRNDTMEIDYFEGKADTSAVRWINDCEYVVKKFNPNSLAEEKSVHMKILSTTDDSYTFEYGIVGRDKKSTGTAVREQ
ncbi:DNA topoisomerase IV [Pricia sp. S334]|uniref:DNA topoisomerase IV n=1 Tax=Pricia mediterranea TaxID=3076079 RepID=A0ABU3LB35_9FLAO|nr:DNA topoisomerase IV [Pricia sp. S334]MDT7830394.1 DNA topoisomerase IV [Pricia sp. S334]